MKICPNCGAENNDNALTCILCEFEFDVENETGATVTVNNENVVPSSVTIDMPVGKDADMAPKSSNKTILIAIASVLVICLGVGGVLLMKNKGDKKSDSSSSSAKVEATSDAISTEEAASTQENTTEAIATTTAQSIETTTITTVDTTTAPAETTTQPQENSIKAFPATEINNYPQYVQAIKDGINNGYYTASSASYALYDLNKDGTPEMIINTAPYGIYAMDGNNCVEIQSTFKATRSPSLSITEKGFVKLSFVDTMGNSSVTYWKYFGGPELAMQDGGEYGNDIALEMTPVSNISDITSNESNNKYTTYDVSSAPVDFIVFNGPAYGIILTKDDPLNLRSAPSTNSDVIIKMPPKSYCQIYGQNDEWCYIGYTENEVTYYGYASREYIGDGGI